MIFREKPIYNLLFVVLSRQCSILNYGYYCILMAIRSELIQGDLFKWDFLGPAASVESIVIINTLISTIHRCLYCASILLSR